MTLESVLFYALSSIGIASAVLVVTRRNPIISALWLIVNFFCLAGLYLTLHAQFIAVIQILVYAGAIMVLFVFVIMLLNFRDEHTLFERVTWKKNVAAGLGLAVMMEMIYIIMTAAYPSAHYFSRSGYIGTIENLGVQLFTKFLLPFEVTSLLLTAAIVGAILLAKKKMD
jgi:NADH-quinone oxidoreductase subunit J